MTETSAEGIEEHDLDALSVWSGIDRAHLEEMHRGGTEPDDVHVYRLRRILGRTGAADFMQHRRPVPESEVVRKNSAPPGTALHRCRADELGAGDKMRYQTTRDRGSSWVTVVGIVVSGFTTTVLLSGDCSFTTRSDVTVRIARAS